MCSIIMGYAMLALKKIFTVLPWKMFPHFYKSYFYLFYSFIPALSKQTMIYNYESYWEKKAWRR